MDPRVLATCWLQVDPGMTDLLWVGPNQMIPVGPIQVITLMRYQTAYERSIERKEKLLERSQRARNDDLPPPIRLEVSEA
jgi:hypothetical protein